MTIQSANSSTAETHIDDSAMKKLSDVGQIKVVLQRCREAGLKPAGDWLADFKGVGDRDVPEKALKGRSISNHTK